MTEPQAIDTAELEAAAQCMADAIKVPQGILDAIKVDLDLPTLAEQLRIPTAHELLGPEFLADIERMEKIMAKVARDSKKMMADLCRMTILDFRDRPIKPLDVPEWGGRLYVRPISLGEREALAWEFKGLTDSDQLNREFKARLFVACVVDKETGQPIFTPDDVPALLDKSAAAIERVLIAMSDLFG